MERAVLLMGFLVCVHWLVIPQVSLTSDLNARCLFSLFIRLEVEVPEEWQPPSIDALWTANLAEDLFQQHPPQQQTWDDASLAELVLGE
jgi:hypothetical protein